MCPEKQIMEETTPKGEQVKQPQRVILSPLNIPHIYVNNFQVGLSLSDLMITMIVNGELLQNVNMSLITAKSLAKTIQTAIEDYEKKTNTQVLLLKEVEGFIRPKK